MTHSSMMEVVMEMAEELICSSKVVVVIVMEEDKICSNTVVALSALEVTATFSSKLKVAVTCSSTFQLWM